jgi:hypothetical protein
MESLMKIKTFLHNIDENNTEKSDIIDAYINLELEIKKQTLLCKKLKIDNINFKIDNENLKIDNKNLKIDNENLIKINKIYVAKYSNLLILLNELHENMSCENNLLIEKQLDPEDLV